MKKRSKYALRAIGVAAAWAAMAGAAQADTVLLGITLDPGNINGLTLEPHQIKVVVKNEPSLPGTATNAPVSLSLPPNLGGLQLISSGGANCSTAPINIPSSTTGASGLNIEWQIASLAPHTSCEYIFEAKPLVVGSYPFAAQVATGPSDNQQAGASNPVKVDNNRSVAVKAVALQVEKTIVQINGQPASPSTDPDLNGIKAFEAGYGQPVRYQLRFTNASDVPLDLGELNDYWGDYEYAIGRGSRWLSHHRPVSSTTDNASCAVQHNTPQPPGTATQSVCPEVIDNDPNIANIVLNGGQGTDLRPIDVARPMSGVVLAAGETMVLEYERTYQPSDCGESLLRNGIEWEVNKYSNSAQSMQVQWQGRNGRGIDEVFLALPMGAQGACQAVELNLQATKKLLEINGQPVTGTGTQALPNPGPGAESSAVFEIKVTNGHTPSLENYLAQPNTPNDILFTLYDLYRTGNFGAAPSFHPNNSLQEQIKVLSCESSIAGKVCALRDPAANGFNPLNPNNGKPWGPIVSGSGSTMWDQIALALDETVTLRMAVQYRHNPNTDAPLCRKNLNTMVNALNVEAVKRLPQDQGVVFSGTIEFNGEPSDSPTGTHQTPLELLAELPLCVSMTTQKNAAITTLPNDVQFTLNFTNSTSANTGLISPVGSPVNPLKQVVFSDPLPASFTADANGVSCEVVSGNALLPNPPISAANIDANNVFKATIPEIEDGAQIRCTIKGKDQTAGLHKNEARADVDRHNGAGSGPTYLDPFGVNVGSATYLISGPQLKLSKTAQGNLQPGGEITWTVVASNISASATNGTINDVVPAVFESFTWTCASTGTAGGSCATANGAGAGGETISVGAVIPAASSNTAVGEITLTIRAKLPAGQMPTRIDNSATLNLPPGAGCIDANNQSSPPPCQADASIGATLVSLSKSALPAGTTTYTAGGEAKFAVEVHNRSATQAVVDLSDALPAGTTAMSWSCQDQANNACGNGAGALSLPALTLAAGETRIYTVTVQVPLSFTGSLNNVARLKPPADGYCQAATGVQPVGQECDAAVNLTPVSGPVPTNPVLRITKTTSSTQLTPGGTAQFTVQVHNPGATAINAVQLSDAMPAGIASQTWTCVAAPAGSCSSAAGNGAVNLTLDLPAGATATVAIAATAEAANLPAQVVNTARITPPTGVVCDPVSCEASAQVPSSTGPGPGPGPSDGIVTVSKTSSSAGVTAGGSIAFEVVVSASGGRDSHGVRIHDPLATGIASQNWRCTAATGGASCPMPDQGSGELNAVLSQLPSGGQIRFQINATTNAGLPVGSQVVNVVTLSDLPSNVLCDPATGCSARNAAVPVIAAPSPSGTVPVPVGAPWMLALLALCLAGLARRQRR
ncbi:MAG: hypothetical protein Q4A97_09555 [Comamonadaceae bacterium]|nr:hypothetical protein [Comamonadaceae bacterium]